MSPGTEQLLASAMALPHDERLQLIDALSALSKYDSPLGEWDSAAKLFDDALLAEAQKRSAQIDAGTAVLMRWPEVNRRVRERLANIFIHPDAQAQYEAALALNKRRGDWGAAHFETAFERALEEAGDIPELYPLRDDRHRFCLLRRYPCSIIYRGEDVRIQVVAVAGPPDASSWETWGSCMRL